MKLAGGNDFRITITLKDCRRVFFLICISLHYAHFNFLAFNITYCRFQQTRLTLEYEMLHICSGCWHGKRDHKEPIFWKAKLFASKYDHWRKCTGELIIGIKRFSLSSVTLSPKWNPVLLDFIVLPPTTTIR